MKGRARQAAAATPLDDDPAQPPPANVEIEQALLGAILVNNGAYGEVAEFLMPEHFANAVHGRIYTAIGTLLERGQVADPMMLKTLFDQDGALAGVGGARYLVQLAASAVTIVNAPHYARTIHDLYLRRVLITIGEEVVAAAARQDLDDPATAQIERAEQQLFGLTEIDDYGRRRRIRAGDAANASLQATENAYREPGKLAGLSSGIAAVDKLIGGFAPGDLYVVGGRPGSGKSSLMGSIAWAAAEAGHPTMIFSGEMTAQQLTSRLLAALSGVSSGRQRRGDVIPAEWQDLIEAQRRIASWPLVIDDGPMTLPRIRQQIRHARSREKLALVMIDYLQLVASGAESESRAIDVGRVSNALKRTAKDAGIPIIAAAQLSRAVEARDDKRPLMSDLRQTGEIEQDADAVMLLYREEVYLARAEPRQNTHESDIKFQERHAQWSNALHDSRGKADLIIAKNRNDREGVAHIRFDAERSFFHDPTDAQQRLF